MKPPTAANGQPLRERMCFFGPEKSGKSFIVANIALWHQKRGRDATFYILDTDLAWQRMLSDDEFSGLENVVYEEVFNWPELKEATNRFREKIKTGDFLVVDMLTQAWEWVQQFYIESVYGMDADDFFLMKQKEVKRANRKTKSGEPIDTINFGDVIEWPIINKLYYPWASKLISHPGHLLACAAEKEIGKRELGKEELKEFQKSGVKIAGQKMSGHLMHDIIRVRSQKPGEPRLNTIGARPRPGGAINLKGEVIKNFSMGCLIKHGGWKL